MRILLTALSYSNEKDFGEPSNSVTDLTSLRSSNMQLSSIYDANTHEISIRRFVTSTPVPKDFNAR